MSLSRQSRGVAFLSLAQSLEIDPDELLRRVSLAGLKGLVRADGTVGMDAIDRIRACARETPGSVMRLAPTVAEMMSQSGVARLDQQHTKKPANKTQNPVPPKSNGKSAPPSPPGVGLQRAEVLREQVIDLERRLAETTKQLRDAQSAQRELTERLDAGSAAQAREALDWAARAAEGERRLAERGAELSALRGALAAAQSAAQSPREEALESVFRRRGLVGEDESVAAMRALLDARRFTLLQSLLRVSDPDEAVSMLRGLLTLHCGREDCPVPSGFSVLRVAADRCEVCEGSDIRRGIRRFSETLMLEALLRVVIVGGSPGYHRMLREGVDRRVDLRLVAGDARRTRSQAQADLSWAQLVIIWGGTILDHKVSELYGGGEVRTLRIAHRGLSGLLDQVVRGL